MVNRNRRGTDNWKAVDHHLAPFFAPEKLSDHVQKCSERKTIIRLDTCIATKRSVRPHSVTRDYEGRRTPTTSGFSEHEYMPAASRGRGKAARIGQPRPTSARNGRHGAHPVKSTGALLFLFFSFSSRRGETLPMVLAPRSKAEMERTAVCRRNASSRH